MAGDEWNSGDGFATLPSSARTGLRFARARTIAIVIVSLIARSSWLGTGGRRRVGTIAVALRGLPASLRLRRSTSRALPDRLGGRVGLPRGSLRSLSPGASETAALIRVAEVHNRDGQKSDGQAVPAADRRGRLRDTSLEVRPVADGGIDVDGVRSRSADSQGDAAHYQHKGRLRSEGLRARWSAHERGAIDTATAARRDPTKSCQARDPIRLSAHAPGGYVCSGKAPARQVISGLRGDAGCGNTSLTTQNLGLGAGSTRGVASWGCLSFLDRRCDVGSAPVRRVVGGERDALIRRDLTD